MIYFGKVFKMKAKSFTFESLYQCGGNNEGRRFTCFDDVKPVSLKCEPFCPKEEAQVQQPGTSETSFCALPSMNFATDLCGGRCIKRKPIFPGIVHDETRCWHKAIEPFFSDLRSCTGIDPMVT